MQKGVRSSVFKCWLVANSSGQHELTSKQVDSVKSNDYVTAKGMADILKVPVSWVYRNANKSIPCFKAGKYLRFNPQEVIEHLKTRNTKKEGYSG